MSASAYAQERKKHYNTTSFHRLFTIAHAIERQRYNFFRKYASILLLFRIFFFILLSNFVKMQKKDIQKGLPDGSPFCWTSVAKTDAM